MQHFLDAHEGVDPLAKNRRGDLTMTGELLMSSRLIAVAAASLMWLGLSPPASAAAVIDEVNDTVEVFDVGDSFDASWSCAEGESNSGGDCTENIAGSMWVDVTAEESSDLFGDRNSDLVFDDYMELTIKLTNESDGTASLTNWGFDIDIPAEDFVELIIINDGEAPTWELSTKNNLSGGITVDACFIDQDASNTNCNSASGTGLPNTGDNMDTITVALIYNEADYDGFLKLSNFGAKFTGATAGGSFELLGEVSVTPDLPNTETEIPEPSTLTLFGIGLTGLGLFGLRRRRRLAAA